MREKITKRLHNWLTANYPWPLFNVYIALSLLCLLSQLLTHLWVSRQSQTHRLFNKNFFSLHFLYFTCEKFQISLRLSDCLQIVWDSKLLWGFRWWDSIFTDLCLNVICCLKFVIWVFIFLVTVYGYNNMLFSNCYELSSWEKALRRMKSFHWKSPKFWVTVGFWKDNVLHWW